MRSEPQRTVRELTTDVGDDELDGDWRKKAGRSARAREKVVDQGGAKELTVVLGSWDDDISELGTWLDEVVVTWLDESGEREEVASVSNLENRRDPKNSPQVLIDDTHHISTPLLDIPSNPTSKHEIGLTSKHKEGQLFARKTRRGKENCSRRTAKEKGGRRVSFR